MAAGTIAATPPRAKISHGGLAWALKGIVVDLTVTRVTTIGVNEHVWRHSRLREKYVTVIDLEARVVRIWNIDATTCH